MSSALTFQRLKWASFTHSAIYTILLIVWLVPGLHGFEAIFGMAHGLGWIAMSIACIAALRLSVIDLRLAVAVAVLGGIGPFIGSYEFVRQARRATTAPVQALPPPSRCRRRRRPERILPRRASRSRATGRTASSARSTSADADRRRLGLELAAERRGPDGWHQPACLVRSCGRASCLRR